MSAAWPLISAAAIDLPQKTFFRAWNAPRTAKADIWCMHGFGDNSLAFADAISSPLAENYNFFAPDIPGCGGSPAPSVPLDIEGVVAVFAPLIEAFSKKRAVVLVGHSMGGLIGTRLVQKLGSRVAAYLNVDGNLTKADANFSSRALKFEQPSEFKKDLEVVIEKLGVLAPAVEKPILARYRSSVAQCDAVTLWHLGRSCAELSDVSMAGEDFFTLKEPHIYLYGERSVSTPTREFLSRRAVPNWMFRGAGHWPMCEQSRDFYNFVAEYLALKRL